MEKLPENLDFVLRNINLYWFADISTEEINKLKRTGYIHVNVKNGYCETTHLGLNYLKNFPRF